MRNVHGFFSEFHDGLHDAFTDVLGKGDIITNNGIGLVVSIPPSYELTLLAASRPLMLLLLQQGA